MNCVLFAKMDQVFSKENKTLKNTGKLEKILEKSGNFVSLEKLESRPATDSNSDSCPMQK